MKSPAKLLLLLLWVSAALAQPLPDPAEVLKRVEERLEMLCADSPTNRFRYERNDVVEVFDADGKIKKLIHKTYDVLLAQGLPRARLVAMNGRTLSADEQKQRGYEERSLERALTQEKAPDYEKPKPWLNEDVFAHFKFVVTGRTNHAGRTALILQFRPQPDAPARTIIDRVVNRMSGVLWVDEEEAEIVRMNISMNEPIRFWGGFLGQLDKFDYSLQRARSPLGVWFNQVSNAALQIRKLFSTSRIRILEKATELQRAE